MDYSEVLASLQNRTLDGVRTSFVVMGGSKFFTVTKFVTMTDDGMIPSVFAFSETFLQKQPAEVRAQLAKMGRALDDEATAVAVDFGSKAEALWKENGAELIRLSAADQKEYMDRIRPLGDKFLGNHENEGVRRMYALLKASAEKTRRK
jgi:C4-dicarboxylate-binding protein DctP